MTTKIGSRQDGEAPELRSDLLTERNRPGYHGGAGSPGSTGRPKNREVENEMIDRASPEGKEPKPATDPSAS